MPMRRRDPPIRPGTRHSTRGFTLIEVLAALAIVALGMMGVIQAVSQTVSNSAYLREKTLAHWIAMNRLTEVRTSGQAPDVDETSGEVEYAGERWHWTMHVTQTQVESLRRIDVDVRPVDADENAKLATVTGFYGTAIAIGGALQNEWDSPPEAGPGSDTAGEQQQQQSGQENPTDTPNEDGAPGNSNEPTQ
jgi:type II secretion system protein I